MHGKVCLVFYCFTGELAVENNSKLAEALNSMTGSELMMDPLAAKLLANSAPHTQQSIAMDGEERLAHAARGAGAIQSESVQVATIRGIMEDSERRGKRSRIIERCCWIVFILIWNFNAIAAYNKMLKPTFDAPGKRTLVRVKQIMDSSSDALEIARARVVEIDEQLIEMPQGLERYEIEAEKGKQLIAITTLSDTFEHYEQLHAANMAMTDTSVTVDSMASWAKKNPGKIFGLDE